MAKIYYRTKAEWAQALADRAQADLTALYSLPATDWRTERHRANSRDSLLAERSKFRGMAERYRARGQ